MKILLFSSLIVVTSAFKSDSVSYREQYSKSRPNEFKVRTYWNPGETLQADYPRERVEGGLTAGTPNGLMNNKALSTDPDTWVQGQLRDQVLFLVLYSFNGAVEYWGTGPVTTRNVVLDRNDGKNARVAQKTVQLDRYAGGGQLLVIPDGYLLNYGQITVAQAQSMFEDDEGKNSVMAWSLVTIEWHSTLLTDKLDGKYAKPPRRDYVRPGDRHMTLNLFT